MNSIKQIIASLKEVLNMPYIIDEATIPKDGIDIAPEQVVGTLHLSLAKYRRLKAALTLAEDISKTIWLQKIF